MLYNKYHCGKRYLPVTPAKKAQKAKARKIATEDSFWARVDKTAGVESCWLWTGPSWRGYGYAYGPSGGRATSRIALIYATGRIPDSDTYALHSCDNKLCCNPAHLRWGTALENAADREQRRYGRDADIRANLKAAAIDLFSEGMSMNRIAGELGITSGMVSGMLAKHRGEIERKKLLASALPEVGNRQE